MKNLDRHKKKHIIILATSLVMSVTVWGTVTNRVKAREGEPQTLWVQLAQDALGVMGITDIVPGTALPPAKPEGSPEAYEIPSEIPTGGTEILVEASGSITSEEETGDAPENRDIGKADKEKGIPGPVEERAEEKPASKVEASPEAALPEAEASKKPLEPQSETGSEPKTGSEAKAASEPKAAGEPETVKTPKETTVQEPVKKSVPSPAEEMTKPGATVPSGKMEVAEPEKALDAAPAEQVEKATTPVAAPVKANKGTILQMTTAAENSTAILQYNYAEKLGDGRGITFGIIGFTTGTYDGNALIRHYTTLNKENSLARYLPALEAIDRLSHNGNDGDSNDSTAGLDGFIEAIQGNMDPLFRQAQMDKLNELYWNPAVKLAGSIGAKNPLTQAFLYDMTVNHGENGTQNFISKATYALGGTPATGIGEDTYLTKLMDLRETYLNNTGNPGADRVAAFRRILTTGNVSLATPFSFTVYRDTFRIDGNIQ